MKVRLNRLFRWSQGNPSKKIGTRKSSYRLRLQGLEDRRLMAAVIGIGEVEYDGDTVDALLISGTEGRDMIEIRYQDPSDPADSDVIATVRDAANGNALVIQQIYSNDAFDVIFAEGFGDNDSIHNRTRFPSKLDGGAGNDGLRGGTADDVLIGGTEDDKFVFSTYGMPDDELGHDIVIEQSNQGRDELIFNNFFWGIELDLSLVEQQTIHEDRLELTLALADSIEDVWGTGYDDIIRGNALANSLSSYDGKDTLEGRGGDDTLFGGQLDDTFVFRGNANLGTDSILEWENEAVDTLDFSAYGQAVTLDLALPYQTIQTVSAGLSLRLSGAAGIEATGIENVIGTSLADTIYGNSRPNSFWGNGSADKLYGRAGEDMLDGGGENDSLYGMGGFDKLYGQQGSDFLDGGFDGHADELWGGGDKDYFVFYYELYTQYNPTRSRVIAQYHIPRANEQAAKDMTASQADQFVFVTVATWGVTPPVI